VRPSPAGQRFYPGKVSSQAHPARVIQLHPVPREPLWRHIVGDVLRRERLTQERRLRDVADEARISMPYLSEIERGRKEASSEVLAAAAHALGLSLADLLTLAQDELARFSRARQPSQPARDLCAGSTAAPESDGAPVPDPVPAEQPGTAEARLVLSLAA
jgi:transcriptional regulator with XRE-family HTH domain